MPREYLAPGVYVEEVPSGARTIRGLPTSVTVFLGRVPVRPGAGGEPVDSDVAQDQLVPVAVHSFGEFDSRFGGTDAEYPLRQGVRAFFINGGGRALIVRVRHRGTASADASGDSVLLTDADYEGDPDPATGLHALQQVEHFNLLCIAPDVAGGDVSPSVYRAALELCVQKRAMLLVDAPAGWTAAAQVEQALPAFLAAIGADGAAGRNGALYFPGVEPFDSAGGAGMQVASGAVAGVIARTDASRGVWKAPAGVEATLNGVRALALMLTDADNGRLNPLGVNCLRRFPIHGHVVWGARTLRGADVLVDEFKYLPVRRLVLHVEQSLLHGLAWVALESTGEPLWASVRLQVSSFLHGLFLEGAFAGQSPRDAFYVRCDRDTMTDAEIERGEVVVMWGLAVIKPGEFAVSRLVIAAQPPVA